MSAVCVSVGAARPPLRRTAQNSRFFSLSRNNFHFFFSLLGGPFRGISRRGFTRQPESPNVHNSRARRFKHHQNSTKRPPRERRKKEKLWAGEGKKKREILGLPPFGAPSFLGSGSHPSGPHLPTLRGPSRGTTLRGSTFVCPARKMGGLGVVVGRGGERGRFWPKSNKFL